MVYAVSYCSLARHQELREMGFNDSKQLTEKTRTALAKTVEANADWIGWAVRALSPQDISTNMLARPPFNLNEMAHQATVQLIAGVLKQGVNVTEIYVDPVGPSAPYQAKLSNLFPGIYIKVEPKADAIYPIVGAASVCAKVTRDQVLQDWQWTEQDLKRISSSFGSGYPSDPNTVRWLNENEDAFFAYPTIARFSWKTISDRPKGLHALEWSEDEDDKDTKSTGVKRKASDFITKKPPAKPYYERTSLCSLLCLRSVSEL
ncbi:ribonuclease HII [Spinellus fusiger]|nr:ribonuclease HII [Spinellus fusiger]